MGFSACSVESTEGAEESEGDERFSYSAGLDENGYWEDITAADYVTLSGYDALEIPASVHEITDEEVDAEVETLLSSYTSLEEVTNRAAENGDTLNIDYVGTVGGVEFEGGSTEGAGTEVTVGTTSYVDDFIEQLIGHNTGESFDIEVTFPEDYGTEELNGKDAVFSITINSISKTVEAELNDEFVAENLSEGYGWNTVAEMREGLLDDLKSNAVLTYVQEYLTNVEVSFIPDIVLSQLEDATVFYYESYAEMYGIELEEFLTTYVGAESMDALLEESAEDIRMNAIFSLAVQAIAEDAGIVATDVDITAYFEENLGDPDFTSYEEEYGIPYLKQMVMSQLVLDRIVENAVLK
jgi:trigger factor